MLEVLAVHTSRTHYINFGDAVWKLVVKTHYIE